MIEVGDIVSLGRKIYIISKNIKELGSSRRRAMGKWCIGKIEFASKEDYKAGCRDLKRKIGRAHV